MMHADFGSCRREFLKTSASGLGYLLFAATSGEKVQANSKPQSRAKAQRVIFLCMTGGPSHVDLFDYKPKLVQDAGREAPVKNGRSLRLTLLNSPWQFKQRGQAGIWISDLLPELSRHADDLCVINSMQTEIPAHPQAYLQMHTGSFRFIRPSMGSWILYGLGSENQNLPGFVTINPPLFSGGARNYGSAFLPAVYQASPIFSVTQRKGQRTGADKETALDLVRPSTRPLATERLELDLAQALNRSRLQQDGGVSPEIEGVMASAELAFRMQMEAPAVTDLSKESEATRELYGIGQNPMDSFGRQCLLARKLTEAGVRFVEVNCGDWDQHRKLREKMTANCLAMDRPVAGLLEDLKRRGLLKDTLVIWGGEFGRTPHVQGNDGRDHNGKGFTMWMAGGGVNAGLTYGKTDEYGYEAVIDPVPIHDWHATILHLLGIDHEKLTFHYAGRDFRLTDFQGKVVKPVLA
jgi:hypothetical protein